MKFERGDVVYGDNPFKDESYSRPWLIISNDTQPFQGDQYIVLALTTKTWHDDRVPITDDDWLDGGTPDSSSILPWSVETLDQDDLDYWQGTLSNVVVTEAVDALVTFVRPMEERLG
jgi:mRNA interferase MazF